MRRTSHCLAMLLLAATATTTVASNATRNEAPKAADTSDPAQRDVAERAAALPSVLEIDPALTRVTFALRLMLVRRIEGRFPLVEGEVRLDRDAGSAEVDVRIDAREVMMERAGHAEWARSPEFFDSANHPWIRFHAQDVPLQLFRDGGSMQGEVSLRGHTRPVTLQVLASPCSEPGLGCPVRARGEIERSEFGMSARRFVLGDRVRLDFEIRVQPANAEGT